MTPSQLRASLILQVEAGQITAQQAAQQLGISRQAFYKWQMRGLKAMMRALEDQPVGRPPSSTDPEKDRLKARVEQLEHQVSLHEQRDKLRSLLKQMEESDPTGSSTKKTRDDPSHSGSAADSTAAVHLA